MFFKRAVITDEISQDFARAVEIARKYGLNGVELRSAWDKNPHELSAAEVKKVQEIVASAGLAVPCIAAPIFKCRLDNTAEYQAHLDIVKRSIDLALQLGATMVRGFTFWDEGNFERDLPRIVEKIAVIEPILKDNKIILAIEYDPATYANSSQKLEQVLRVVAADAIRALYDPGNNIFVPGAEKPFPDGYERLRPYIAHIHVKDGYHQPVTGAPEACRIGEGEVGFAELFQRLARDGYQGWLSLETHYRKNAPLSEDLLALPKGSAFSIGGEEASIECLESWNDMLRTGGLA